MEEQEFKIKCNELFPEFIKVENVCYCFYAGYIWGHNTCRIFYYNGHINKTLIETFFSKNPDESIADFTEKFKIVVYEVIDYKEFFNAIYPDDKKKVDVKE